MRLRKSSEIFSHGLKSTDLQKRFTISSSPGIFYSSGIYIEIKFKDNLWKMLI